jgi:endo-1,4-beta-D-glucanase Y
MPDVTTPTEATSLVKIMQTLETKIRQHHANVKSRKAKDQAEKDEIDALRDVLKDAMQAALKPGKAMQVAMPAMPAKTAKTKRQPPVEKVSGQSWEGE